MMIKRDARLRVKVYKMPLPSLRIERSVCGIRRDREGRLCMHSLDEQGMRPESSRAAEARRKSPAESGKAVTWADGAATTEEVVVQGQGRLDVNEGIGQDVNGGIGQALPAGVYEDRAPSLFLKSSTEGHSERGKKRERGGRNAPSGRGKRVGQPECVTESTGPCVAEEVQEYVRSCGRGRGSARGGGRGRGRGRQGPSIIEERVGADIGGGAGEEVVDMHAFLDVSVTVVFGGCDVPEALYTRMVEFLKQNCRAGVVALERGSSLDHLHVQAVMRIDAKTPSSINIRIKNFLGWNQTRPAGAMILCKALRGSKLHCFEDN